MDSISAAYSVVIGGTTIIALLSNTVLLQDEKQIITLTASYSVITGGIENHISHNKLQCCYRRNSKSFLSQQTTFFLQDKQQIVFF